MRFLVAATVFVISITTINVQAQSLPLSIEEARVIELIRRTPWQKLDLATQNQCIVTVFKVLDRAELGSLNRMAHMTQGRLKSAGIPLPATFVRRLPRLISQRFGSTSNIRTILGQKPDTSEPWIDEKLVALANASPKWWTTYGSRLKQELLLYAYRTLRQSGIPFTWATIRQISKKDLIAAGIELDPRFLRNLYPRIYVEFENGVYDVLKLEGENPDDLTFRTFDRTEIIEQRRLIVEQLRVFKTLGYSIHESDLLKIPIRTLLQQGIKFTPFNVLSRARRFFRPYGGYEAAYKIVEKNDPELLKLLEKPGGCGSQFEDKAE